jgi:tRNA threonylcarbamoyladenosine biosynthesis protein TsaB
MNYILAIDTCTRLTSVALRDSHVLLAEIGWQCERHHTAAVGLRIKHMLDECGVNVSQLGAIAVAMGPGSFTGVRCGLAIAKGMSVASVQSLPLVGIHAFDILIAAQPANVPAEAIYVYVEVGRNRVAVQPYDAKTRKPVGTFFIKTHAECLGMLNEPVYVCGDLPPQIRNQSHIHCAPAPLNLRRAGFLAELGYERWQRGDVDNVMKLAPIYPPQVG